MNSPIRITSKVEQIVREAGTRIVKIPVPGNFEGEVRLLADNIPEYNSSGSLCRFELYFVEYVRLPQISGQRLPRGLEFFEKLPCRPFDWTLGLFYRGANGRVNFGELSDHLGDEDELIFNFTFQFAQAEDLEGYVALSKRKHWLIRIVHCLVEKRFVIPSVGGPILQKFRALLDKIGVS